MDRRRGNALGDANSKSNNSSGNSGGTGGDNSGVFDASNYLTIYALADGLEVKFSTNGLRYSTNSIDWIELPSRTYTPAINKGDVIMFKGELPSTPNTSHNFSITKRCKLTGNCMSLYFGDNAANIKSLSGYDYAFRDLFEDCTTIEEVSDTFLPATTLSSGCYERIFCGCTNLTKAPKLPALAVPYRGYWQMFEGCEQLANAPELPAKSLGNNCYNYMFYGCKSLLTAPELPATTISEGCYHAMFENCVNLTTPPSILPSYNMRAYCYQNMFRGCVSLMSAPKILAESFNTYCFESMFEGCISLTSAPDLLADSITSYAYRKMFKGCSNLNYIKMLATKISETDLTDWVLDVSNTGTFVKHPNMTSLPTGTSGIPSGWTVYNEGEEPEQESTQVAGDVAYYTNGEIKTISKDKWNSSLGTPIGVVVIPSNFLPDGKARIVSLKAVNSSGNATTSHSSMKWGVSGTNTTLTDYTKVPITNNTGSVSSSSNSYGYLPSDNFTGDTSFVDSNAKYGTTNTNKIPSPYNGNEFNTDYSKDISGNNALSDFNGLSNTQVLVGLGSGYVAANAAYNYSDGVSNIQWYLPSAGELGFMVARFKTINSTISMLSGVAVPSTSFWSSTEYSSYYACNVNTFNGYVYYNDKDIYGYVRPFAMI